MRHIYITLIALLLLSSCDDYLDVKPKGKVIPTTIEDFDLLLVGGDYGIPTTSDETPLFYSADDMIPSDYWLGEVNNPSNQKAKFYKWDSKLFLSNAVVNLWNDPYNSVYSLNLIVNSIDGASGANESDKPRIKAEARTMRAYEYFILINSFAKQFSSSSANNDPGVPIVTEADINVKADKRASVQEVYDFILKDLSESVENLPDVAKGKTRPGKAAGYGLLARVYLQMGEYAKAKENATLALTYNNSLGDYVGSSVAADYPKQQFMYRYFGGVFGYTDGSMSQELKGLFDLVNDKRPNGLWRISGENVVYGWQTYISHCVSVPEMYVIRAECNARLESTTVDDVLTDLNDLRRNRIVNYTDSTVVDKQAALRFALDERRRELFTTGIRWFDLKRLNLEANFETTITRIVGEETYTLEPNSNKYVFPIPPEVKNFNPNMDVNPRD